jgi:HlyD family secretion protein
MAASLQDPPPTPGAPASGAAMDRRVTRRRWPRALVAGAGGVVTLLVLALGYALLRPGGGRTLSLDGSQVAVATVTRGVFEDFIPVRGRVKPLHTVFLDAMEGGRVEKLHVEEGAVVKAGQPLVDLSNTAIQLDVISREAQVIEQLNQLRMIELNLETSRLQHRRELAELDYQVTHARRLLERAERLHASGQVSEAEVVDDADQYESFKRRLEISRDAARSEDELRGTQLVELRRGTDQLKRNLTIARANLEALLIKAPVDGQVTALRLEVGQSLARGERLAQLDDPAHAKLVAGIDEYYLSRVEVGQTGSFEWMGKTHVLRVAKTYPQVRDGQFEADLVFTGEQPAGLRRGQTLQARLSLSEPGPEQLVVRNGAFYQDTGGSWVFVVSPAGTQAVRRNVRLGRRSSEQIEIIDGLTAGEVIITSPYTSYLDKDRLQLRATSR